MEKIPGPRDSYCMLHHPDQDIQIEWYQSVRITSHLTDIHMQSGLSQSVQQNQASLILDKLHWHSCSEQRWEHTPAEHGTPHCSSGPIVDTGILNCWGCTAWTAHLAEAPRPSPDPWPESPVYGSKITGCKLISKDHVQFKSFYKGRREAVMALDWKGRPPSAALSRWKSKAMVVFEYDWAREDPHRVVVRKVNRMGCIVCRNVSKGKALIWV